MNTRAEFDSAQKLLGFKISSPEVAALAAAKLCGLVRDLQHRLDAAELRIAALEAAQPSSRPARALHSLAKIFT